MYRIREDEFREKYMMLIPAMLDAHFPLLKYAFFSKKYHPVILENEENITDIGLKYVNNDMCYPAILNIGQLIGALQSGKYDLDRTVLLMPQAGDACRGSNYTSVLRRAVKNAGFPQVKVLSLNVKGLEKDQQVSITAGMVWRALFAVFYGDMLMILSNQVRPYESHPGDTDDCRKRWHARLAEELKSGRHLTFSWMKRNMNSMAEEFAAIVREKKDVQKIGIVGELYVKYCHIGNWNLRRLLREEHCEYYINGLTWYVLYYIDTHLTSEGRLMGMLYRVAGYVLEKLQKRMVETIKAHGFYSMEPFTPFKKRAEGIVNYGCQVGDGWLIGAEAVSHIENGYTKVIAVQPFGCMPNHVCGRGLYPALQRRYPWAQIAGIDFDSSGSPLNVRNRIQLLIDYRKRTK